MGSENYQYINKVIVATIEKLIRALSRLFIADLGTHAKLFTPEICQFLRLNDDQLGKTEY
ncbi:MAG: hypothetical protein CVV64_11025 [Candidatus Wallbacteria bacterium HGW-Wallbacteria-1]|jgi:hypothetical protein|uniref:Uncharacterized protein n=1 Tax=Candidatus Wallbacteria bacterium HGW-Wallbacteria-1 TaxID=2013854 RepID=A0A2N1PNW8_9BACT|nr:MAG: hypothetical protein CVV64_11025 [Candidatus Wallbacteria bacterium HGW-Wallbacteria-1]